MTENKIRLIMLTRMVVIGFVVFAVALVIEFFRNVFGMYPNLSDSIELSTGLCTWTFGAVVFYRHIADSSRESEASHAEWERLAPHRKLQEYKEETLNLIYKVEIARQSGDVEFEKKAQAILDTHEKITTLMEIASENNRKGQEILLSRASDVMGWWATIYQQLRGINGTELGRGNRYGGGQSQGGSGHALQEININPSSSDNNPKSRLRTSKLIYFLTQGTLKWVILP